MGPSPETAEGEGEWPGAPGKRADVDAAPAEKFSHPGKSLLIFRRFMN